MKRDAYTAVAFSASASYGTKTVSSVVQGTEAGFERHVAFILSIAGQPTIDARCVVLDQR
jgi:hypothetical protein